MMKISERAQRIPDSPIRKLVPLADQARALGRTVYGLNIGQPDLPTPQPFLDAVHGFKPNTIAYGKSEGEVAYRQGLVKYYAQCGVEVTPDQIVVTVGGSEAILFALQITTEPGDDVIAFEPFYTNYNSYAMICSAHVKPVRMKADTGFALPPDAEIEAAIGPRTKAIIICSPNNPTGAVLTEAELTRLAALAKKHNLFIISDEVYREFVYSGRHMSILQIPGIEDRAILVDSISKRYSACGARIGCLVTKNPDARAAAVRLGQARLSPPIIEQEAALRMAELGPSFFAPVLEEYKKRRDVTYEGLMKIPGVVCRVPNGAFYIMAELPIADCEAFARWLLSDFHHENETLMVAPGPGFYARGKYESQGQGLNQVRLAYVLEAPKLARAMNLLARAVDQYATQR